MKGLSVLLFFLLGSVANAQILKQPFIGSGVSTAWSNGSRSVVTMGGIALVIPLSKKVFLRPVIAGGKTTPLTPAKSFPVFQGGCLVGYLLPEYQTNQAEVLTDYVDLVENLVNQDKLDHLPLTIIVPDFYTATEQWTPEITVDGITAYTYDQIVRLLNELQGSRIIVMAYRNTAIGPNGSIALAAPEVQGADGSNVVVLVAQETGPVTPSYVTFNGLSRSDLFAAAATIDEAFASDKSFGGIAVDYLNPFLNLP